VLVAVVIAVVLFGSIATWGLVVSALRRLHSTESPTAQRQTAHQIRVVAVLGLAGFVLTFAAYTILLHLLGVSDDSVGGFFLFGAVVAICLAPAMTLAVRYGEQRRRKGGTHEHRHLAP
jgi:hypothetical protein